MLPVGGRFGATVDVGDVPTTVTVVEGADVAEVDGVVGKVDDGVDEFTVDVGADGGDVDATVDVAAGDVVLGEDVDVLSGTVVVSAGSVEVDVVEVDDEVLGGVVVVLDVVLDDGASRQWEMVRTLSFDTQWMPYGQGSLSVPLSPGCHHWSRSAKYASCGLVSGVSNW